MKLEVITLENGIEYAILKEINNYVLLVNPNNPEDFCFRKNVIRDGQEFIESLDTDEEFEEASKLFKENMEK